MAWLRRVMMALALLLWPSPGGASEKVDPGKLDLQGAWHVVVHYTDAGTVNQQQERWEDRLWVFARQGSRLEWTDYPIVVFDDQTGRFERLGTNRASRVLHYWEPNEAQLAEIQKGLQYNSRGARTKVLKEKDGVWTSARGGGAYASARFITYSEVWRIEGLPERPVFIRDDVMGSVATEQLEGRTVYETQQVEAGGDLLRGRYQRDERRGSFRMTRSGTPEVVRGSGKSQEERVYEAFFGQMAGQLLAEGFSGATSEAELRKMIEKGEVSPEAREEVRKHLRDSIEEQYRNQGNDPRAFRPQIQALTEKIEGLYLDEGTSSEEISEMLRNGQLRP